MNRKYSLISLLILASYPALAAQSATADAVITVTAPASSPLFVTTSPKLPRQPVPASDGADYLKTIPGFGAIRNGGTNGDPVFRGMADSRLRILVDGAEMLGACPNRMDSPTSYIAPEEFDTLKIIKGPETVLWGPGNSAGTVLFQRQPPQFEKMGVQGSVTALAGSNDRYDGNADLSVGNKLGYLRLLGSHSRASDYKDGAGHRVHSSWDKWSSDIALGITPTDDTLIELSAGTGDGKAAYAGRDMDGVVFRRKSLGLRFEWNNISDTFQKLEGQINYNYARHLMDNYSLRPIKKGKTENIMPFDRYTVSERLMGTWQWSEVKLETGLDRQTYTHRNIPGMKYKNGTTQPDFTKDARYEDVGVFGQMTWQLNQENKLIGGARIDRTIMTNFPQAQEKRTATLPSGFMRIEHDFASAPAMIYAGIGYVERFPDYWELFSNDNGNGKAKYQPGVVPVGDPFNNLKPEKTTQLDIGAQYKGEHLSAWLSGYVGYINDFILFKFGKKPGMMMGNGKMMMGNGKMMMKDAKAVGNINARIMGAEAGVGYQITSHWKTDASLAYAYGQNITENKPLPQMPPIEARFSTTYEQHGVSGTLLWRVVSKQNRTALYEGNLVGQDLDKTPGFGILSANLAWKITKTVQLSAGVDNLFNKLYTEHLNKQGAGIPGYNTDGLITEPGRTYWAKLNVTF